jgi:archaemetzincin
MIAPKRFGLILAFTLILCVSCMPSGSTPASATPIPTESPRLTAQNEDGFTPPNEEERKKALGRDPEPIFIHLLSFFKPLPKPGPRDWLASQSESGQTFRQYEASMPNRPDEVRNKIYILPLGKFGEDAPPLEQVREYTSLFFDQPVVLLDPVENPQVTTRQNELTWQKQWLTGDLLDHLESSLPPDAYCLLGITLTDLYPDEDWNYVFGMAALKRRVGVYSLARYDPRFFGNDRGEDWKVKSLERSCKVLAHETSHMMGIRHCIYYRCLMNGSNNLSELDSQNSFLCPICLRKLKYALNPDLDQRYRKLQVFFAKAGLTRQVDRLSQILQ